MNWSTALRNDLIDRARTHASDTTGFYLSLGSPGTVLFEPGSDGSHGNFAPESYAEILARPEWESRLHKSHSQKRALPENKRSGARELDSCTSSDALLMNVGCFPGMRVRIATLLGEPPDAEIEFGVAGQVPLNSGGSDATEIDCRLGSTIIEAKLTEGDFTSKSRETVYGYRDFRSTFVLEHLPQDGTTYSGYQLIRNVLAAAAHGYRFHVLCDTRRPDLIQGWWAVHSAIADPELRARCGLLTWQELAAIAPGQLRRFLAQKYGILARDTNRST